MKIETIENEKKMSEWPVPCLVHNDGIIVFISAKSSWGGYEGFIIKSENAKEIGEQTDYVMPENGWTLYDGKVILSNN